MAAALVAQTQPLPGAACQYGTVLNRGPPQAPGAVRDWTVFHGAVAEPVPLRSSPVTGSNVQTWANVVGGIAQPG